MARKPSDSPHTTGELRAAVGLDLSHLQRPGVTKQDEFQKLSEVRTQTHTRLHTHTHTKARGRRGGGGEGRGGATN